jgi:hypothetical protein
LVIDGLLDVSFDVSFVGLSIGLGFGRNTCSKHTSLGSLAVTGARQARIEDFDGTIPFGSVADDEGAVAASLRSSPRSIPRSI